jgi:DTW domain-containing protein YfiP
LARCGGCQLPLAACACALLPQLETRTPLLLFQHAIDARRPSNTGNLVLRLLPSVRRVLHGAKDDAGSVPVLDPALRRLVLDPSGRPLQREDAQQPFALLLADGTWHQARHMHQRIAALREAEPVSLPPRANANPTLRRRPSPERLSTCEAVAYALGILESPTLEAQIMDALALVTKRWLGYRSPRRPLRHGLTRATGGEPA